MCVHNNHLNDDCDYCVLEETNYFGYDSTLFNDVYNILLEESIREKNIIIKRKFFHTTGYFKKYYDLAKIQQRADKIKSLYV